MKTLVLLLLSTHLMPQAQKSEVMLNRNIGWHKIGEAKIDFTTDKDNFILTSTGKFKCLQIKARDAPVLIEYMQVEYQKNVKEELAISSELRVGSDSKVIQLRNSNSGIKNVTIIYRMVSNPGIKQAQLELWGLK
jgi:hypothetical protein